MVSTLLLSYTDHVCAGYLIISYSHLRDSVGLGHFSGAFTLVQQQCCFALFRLSFFACHLMEGYGGGTRPPY
jgi:hypothetical protein